MNLIDEFKKGVLYSAIGKYSNVIVQLLVQAILSRLLTPKEYGVVAVVNVFLVFFQLLADFGIGPAIIQNKQLTKKEINSIFVFSCYLAIVLGLVFMALGYPISLFYKDAIYIPISLVLGVCVFFYGILVVPQNMLLREKNFMAVNIVTVVANVLSGVVSIVLAFAGFSYYSLIISNTLKAAFLFFVFYFKTKLTVSFRLDLNPIKKIFSFSKNQFIFNFINYFSGNLDKILIGRFFSTSSLAYYDKSYQLSLYPNQILTNVIYPVIQPIMSDYETRMDKIKQVYLLLTRFLGTIGLSLSIFLFFSAKEIILFLFGGQWGGSVATFQILAFSVWIQLILTITGAIFQSANRTDLLLVSGVLTAITNITAMVVGIYSGKIETVALLLVIAFTLNFLQTNYLLMYKLFDSTYLEFFKILIKPALMAGFQAVGFLLLPTLPFSNFINLVIKSLIFILIFGVGLIVTGEMKAIKDILAKRN
ncbi:lipopolysaccharide biosynthesis protein [Carnobacterium sp. TMP28]|uniref:lipopolysaccharide biosynthesis protein n=1 Tax=Carnobacterium sp. TMP28 TaxID=3397060 RepID=UPI0039DF35CB